MGILRPFQMDIFAEFDNYPEDKEDTDKCPHCKGSNKDFIVKSNEGAQICRNCGTHISDTLISMKQEWTNGDESGIERCSTTIDPLLVHQSKSTWWSGIPYNMIKNHMFHNFYVHKEQGLIDLYNMIDKIGERNKISLAIRDHAKKYCKLISNQNIKRGKSRIGMIGATIGQAYKYRLKVHLSEDKLAEICGIEKKYIQRGIDKLAEFNFSRGINPEEFLVPRTIENYAEEYMLALDIADVMVQKICCLIETIEKLLPHINNMPSSIAGSCIFYVFVEELKLCNKGEIDETKVNEFKKLIKKKCNLNEITISNCYNNILRVLEQFKS